MFFLCDNATKFHYNTIIIFIIITTAAAITASEFVCEWVTTRDTHVDTGERHVISNVLFPDAMPCWNRPPALSVYRAEVPAY